MISNVGCSYNHAIEEYARKDNKSFKFNSDDIIIVEFDP